MAKHVRVFLNARSGAGKLTGENLCKLFADHGCGCILTVLKDGLNVTTLAANDPPEVPFIAAGGDGTVNVVASSVAGTSRSMGVLPVGTLNHFAKDLGLPLDLEEAVRVAVGKTHRIVDAAQVNGRIFVNNSSLGVYPTMVFDRDLMKKRGWNKWASLTMACAKAFVRFRCIAVDYEVDGVARHCTTPLLFVGNNEYCMDGARLGKRSRLDSGTLSLYLAPGADRASMMRMMVAALLGRVKEHPQYTEFSVKRLVVNVRKRNLRVSFDGEVRRMAPPLTYSIMPGALRVLCQDRVIE